MSVRQYDNVIASNGIIKLNTKVGVTPTSSMVGLLFYIENESTYYRVKQDGSSYVWDNILVPNPIIQGTIDSSTGVITKGATISLSPKGTIIAQDQGIAPTNLGIGETLETYESV